MGVRTFETYKCDVCNREKNFWKGAYSVKQEEEKAEWLFLSCDGVKFGEHFTRGGDGVLVCESVECRDEGFERILGSLRAAFSKHKKRLELNE